MGYAVHTPSSAPEASREILEGAAKAFGFVPNMLATMAGAPALLKAYTTLSRLFDETSLSPTERQIVLLTVSRENVCEYCMAAHTAIAQMQRVPADVIEALRNDKPIQDERLETLRRFTRSIVESRGWPTEDDKQRFLSAGYGTQQILEVVLGVGMKTLSNYTNHLAGTPLDQAFARAAWKE